MRGRTVRYETEITPVFGLTKRQLRPIVENIAEEPVVTFDVSVEHRVRGHYGYSAQKVVPTFTYTTRTGRGGHVAVFAKYFYHSGPKEACHYAWLEEHGGPVPHMYGTLTDPDNREIVFLEYLDPIGDVNDYEHFLDGPDHYRQVLDVMARFNAIRPSAEYAAPLPTTDAERERREMAEAATDLGKTWEAASKSDLGPTLRRLCAGLPDRVRRLQALAESLVEPVSRMETGLEHGDLYVDNTARRRSTGELLVFDLESIGLWRRLSDVAKFLGQPDEVEPRFPPERELAPTAARITTPGSVSVEPRCLPQRELAQYYLNRFEHWGGERVPLDQFLNDTRLLWLKGVLSILWWWRARAIDGRVDWTDDAQRGRAWARKGLQKGLSGLLHEVE